MKLFLLIVTFIVGALWGAIGNALPCKDVQHLPHGDFLICKN